MCLIELVDFNVNLTTTREAPKPKAKRRRGGKKAAAQTADSVDDKKDTASTEVAEDQVSMESEPARKGSVDNKESEEENTTGSNK
jgi:hypothetical protein